MPYDEHTAQRVRRVLVGRDFVEKISKGRVVLHGARRNVLFRQRWRRSPRPRRL